jgi:hypothetical protein
VSNEATIAAIGRRLAVALSFRARERSPEALRKVLEIQTELCAAVKAEATTETVEVMTFDKDGMISAGFIRKDMLPLASSTHSGTRPDGLEAPT